MEPINCVADVRADSLRGLGRHAVPDRRPAPRPRRSGAQARAGDVAHDVAGRRVRPAGERRQPLRRRGGAGLEGGKEPVKVMWTREDDMRGGYYRPMWLQPHPRRRSTRDGRRRRGSTRSSASRSSPARRSSRDDQGRHRRHGGRGRARLAVRDPERPRRLHTTPVGVPALWWRSVGHSHTAFVVESFIDELAHAAGKDPVEYPPRAARRRTRATRACSNRRGEGGLGQAAARGAARGIAVHESFGSYVAHVAEVSVGRGGLRVHRVALRDRLRPRREPRHDRGPDRGRDASASRRRCTARSRSRRAA